MATQYHEPGGLPEGVVLQHTLYGEPHTQTTHAHTAAGLHSGAVQPAPDDGVPWNGVQATPESSAAALEVAQQSVTLPEPVDTEALRGPERAKRCHAKDDTCRGWKMTDSDYCAAHTASMRYWQQGERHQPQ